VAGYLPADQGAALLGVARSAFVEGMDVAVLVGAVVAIAGAIVALALLPGRTPASQPAPHIRAGAVAATTDRLPEAA
jgi:hypothetical protein